MIVHLPQQYNTLLSYSCNLEYDKAVQGIVGTAAASVVIVPAINHYCGLQCAIIVTVRFLFQESRK